MDVMTLSEVMQSLARLRVQGDVEAGLKLVGVGIVLALLIAFVLT